MIFDMCYLYTYYITLYYYFLLYYIILYIIILYYVMLYYIISYIILYYVILYYIILYDIILYYMILYDMILYYIICIFVKTCILLGWIIFKPQPGVLMMVLFCFGQLPGFSCCWHDIRWSTWSLCSGLLVTSLVAMFWRPQTQVFFDRICVSQVENDLKTQAAWWFQDFSRERLSAGFFQ